MRNFLKFSTFVLAMVIASVSFGQTADKAGKDKASELTAKLSRNLSLSAEQTTTVKKMATDYYVALEQLNKEDGTYADKKRKRIEGEYMNKMKEVLNADQYTKFEEFVREQRSAGQTDKK